MKKLNLTPVYIIHSCKYKENSLLIDVFSREYGVLKLLAKGARKNKRQQGIGFSLYQQYLFSWYLKTDLGILTDIELSNPITVLKGKRILLGFYLNEIIIRLLNKHEPFPDLFDYYCLTLINLINNSAEEIFLRFFEKKLLQSIGYGLVLDHDVHTGNPIVEGKDYYYQFERGPSIVSSNSKNECKVSGETLIGLKNESFINVKLINEARLLLRSVLAIYLGSKPLASKELYGAYMKNIKN